MTKHLPIIVEQEINVPLKEAWHSLTDLYEMRNWYFYLDEFKPDIGYSFHFIGGDDKEQYVHLCIITNVEEYKLLSHTWRYKDYDGDSEVTFELTPHHGNTIVTLTHTGTESFEAHGKNFSRESFTKGWQQIISVNLKEYLENK